MLKQMLLSVGASAALATAVPAAMGPASATNPSFAQRFETRVLTQMIDRDNTLVALVNQLQGQTVHPELQALASAAQTAATTEITTLQGWLHDWYGVDYTPSTSSSNPRAFHRLSGLTGNPFEQEFLRLLIANYGAALEQSSDALLRANHADLINLGATRLGSEADDTAQLRLWQSTWYPSS